MIKLIDLTRQYKLIQKEVEAEISRLCESQYFILGPVVDSFEKEVATYINCTHAIGCASGSDALFLALLAYGIGHGDEVITTPFTFFATAGAISRTGAKPVFIDIDPVSFNMDPALIKGAITPRTKAIIAVHLYGQVADMDPIIQIANDAGIPVIEDAAQTIGSVYKGRSAGTIGQIGCFSFFPTKNLGGFGDGGLLSAEDPSLAKTLRMLRVHGSEKRYYHDLIGINSRLDTLQAAVLRIKLRYLAEWTATRQENAAFYDTAFAGISEIQSPVVMPYTTNHVYNQYVIRVQNRDALRTYLLEKGVETEVYYPVPLHLQNCYQDLGHKPGDFPESEKAAAEVLALPIYPELTIEEKDAVVVAVKRFFKQA